eukprot:tig00001576_g9363.t1
MCQGNGRVPVNSLGQRPVTFNTIQFHNLHEIIARAIQDCAPELIKPLLAGTAVPDGDQGCASGKDSVPSTRNASPSPSPVPRKPTSLIDLSSQPEVQAEPDNKIVARASTVALRKVKSHGANLDDLASAFECSGRFPADRSVDRPCVEEESPDEDDESEAAARRRGLEVDAAMDSFPGPRKLEILGHWMDCVSALERVYRNYPSSATRSVDTKLLIDMVERKRADIIADPATPILRLVRRMQQQLFAKRTPQHFLSSASVQQPLTSGGPCPSSHQRFNRRTRDPYFSRTPSGPPSRSRSPGPPVPENLVDPVFDPLLGAPPVSGLKVCVHRGPPVNAKFYPCIPLLAAAQAGLTREEEPEAPIDLPRPRYFSMPAPATT